MGAIDWAKRHEIVRDDLVSAGVTLSQLDLLLPALAPQHGIGPAEHLRMLLELMPESELAAGGMSTPRQLAPGLDALTPSARSEARRHLAEWEPSYLIARSQREKATNNWGWLTLGSGLLIPVIPAAVVAAPFSGMMGLLNRSEKVILDELLMALRTLMDLLQ